MSTDGTTWGQPIATGAGMPGITSVSFPPQTAQYIRIIQTGTDPQYNWSIYEFDVFQTNQ